MSRYSILIPAKNEEKNILETIEAIRSRLIKENILYEIIIVNDYSTDTTSSLVHKLSQHDPAVWIVNNPYASGVGHAIRYGLERFNGDYVIIVMADGSDDPNDIVRYIYETEKGFDCCFGSRWEKGVRVDNYPKHKLLLNRLVNRMIALMFGIKYKDITNAFKCYSRNTIKSISPVLSRHFNFTVELPLKAIVRGYSYSIIPTNWYGRKHGMSNLKIKEMGSRYTFIIIYLFLEKLLCGKDYWKKQPGDKA
jgi:dolichol-phosphate mannosyltransferase